MKTFTEMFKYVATSALFVVLVGADISPALAEGAQQIDIDTLVEYNEIYYQDLPSMDLKDEQPSIKRIYKIDDENEIEYAANYFKISI